MYRIYSASRQRKKCVTPVSLDVFSIPVSLRNDFKAFISIDRGCSLTKITYVSESSSDKRGSDTFPLTCAVFHNDNFEEGLEWVKREGWMKQGSVHVTGAGATYFDKTIERILGLKTEFLNEFISQIQGLKFLINNMSLDEITFCDEAEEDLGFSAQLTEIHKKVIQNIEGLSSRNENNSEEHKFPGLFVLVGSGCGIFSVAKDGNFSSLGGLTCAGKSFLGLAQVLLGTTDYDEISKLADSGQRSKVDTQVMEMVKDDPTSPYGHFSPELSIFPFGKAADYKKDLNSFEKCDVAASLVAMFANNIISAVVLAATSNKIFQIYLGGNLFRSQVFRREALQLIKMFGFQNIKLHFIKTGNTGAIGALLMKPGSEMEFVHKA